MDNIEFEPECKSRGMETGLHSRGEASVALEREFTRMVKEHRKTIYTVCYFFSKDADEVNDLFQEILINLWKGFPKFRGESSHKTWIWRVSLNTCNNRCGFERDGSYSTKKEDRWQMFDVGVACQTFCLAAHEQGLGTVIMGIWDEDGITKLLDIPENQELAALVAIGYPEDIPSAPKRKTVEDLLTYR